MMKDENYSHVCIIIAGVLYTNLFHRLVLTKVRSIVDTRKRMNEFERLNIDDEISGERIIEDSKEEIDDRQLPAHIWKQRNALISLMMLQEELCRHGVINFNVYIHILMNKKFHLYFLSNR